MDGTCCRIKDGKLWKRYSCNEDKKGIPESFVLDERKEQKDRKGRSVVKLYGWVPVGDGPQDKYHREAIAAEPDTLVDGTYELCGPKVQGNPEHDELHELWVHGGIPLPDAPRTFELLKDYFTNTEPDIEGIVWHHPDGRMVKIKAKDFGLQRRPK